MVFILRPTPVISDMSIDPQSASAQQRRAVNFDPLARPYRWLEYLTLGRLLEHRRFAYLQDVADRKNALLLGDGDGRFLARLLAQNTDLSADAVDSSEKMLELLQSRVRAVGASDRVRVMRADAAMKDAGFGPRADGYDLVVTHFFLDCFTDHELETILNRIVPKLARDAVWIVSEFTVPPVGPKVFARILVGFLYIAFGLFTGLSIRSLPDYSAVLRSRGFVLQRQTTSMHGILVSELWRRKE